MSFLAPLLLAGCNQPVLSPLAERVVADQAVLTEAAQGPPEAILTTPEGALGVIRRPPILPEDICYVRSRTVRGALVPVRCETLVSP